MGDVGGLGVNEFSQSKLELRGQGALNGGVPLCLDVCLEVAKARVPAETAGGGARTRFRPRVVVPTRGGGDKGGGSDAGRGSDGLLGGWCRGRGK